VQVRQDRLIAKLFTYSSELEESNISEFPVVVEIVDSQEKIDAFLPVLDDMMSSGNGAEQCLLSGGFRCKTLVETIDDP
jgi:hypothetical protein